jgi:hypothetical protein
MNKPSKRTAVCPDCGKTKRVNDLGRIAAHDIPKRRGHRCSGGGVLVARMRMPTANRPHYVALN